MNSLTAIYLSYQASSSSTSNIAKVFEELLEVLSYHNKLYYEEAKPVLSDGEYDALFSLLIQLEKMYPEHIAPDSPTKKVGAIALADGFTKAVHPVPLISLANSYNAQDIQQWHTQLARIAEKEGIETWSYIVEPKLDGSSVEIVYTYGHFTQAITRGNGQEGEDITANVKVLRNLPLYIAGFKDIQEIRLRGEIVLPQSSFERLNQKQAELDEALFANPRNAAAGTLRQLDAQIVHERGLVIFVYDILLIENGGLKIESDKEQLEWLQECGIPVYPWHKTCTTAEEVISYCQDTGLIKQLEEGNIEMDGLVIKVNEIGTRDIFGATEHHPRRAMAFKFPTKQIAAKIRDITYQVGRTGAITPVAELDPVALGGVTISRATLHNFDYITDRDIRKGDRVWVQRSGEVIPYILGPIEARRTGKEEIIGLLEQCPGCNAGLIKSEGEVALLCPNDACEAKLVQQLQHFVGKNSLDIRGLGNSIVELLVQHKIVQSIADLYTLKNKVLELKSLPGMGDKKINTITQELEESKTKPLRRWIHGFGIKFVGKKTSQDIVKGMKSWGPIAGNSEALSGISGGMLLQYFIDSEYLETVFGLGKQTIASLGNWTQELSTKQLISSLQENGVVFSLDDSNIQHSKALQEKTLVITGSFDGYTRDTLSQMIQQHGGSVSSSISKKTNYLLAGEKAGSKYTKAQELGVEIIGLEQFGALIGEIFTVTKKSAEADQGSLF